MLSLHLVVFLFNFIYFFFEGTNRFEFGFIIPIQSLIATRWNFCQRNSPKLDFPPRLYGTNIPWEMEAALGVEVQNMMKYQRVPIQIIITIRNNFCWILWGQSLEGILQSQGARYKNCSSQIYLNFLHDWVRQDAPIRFKVSTRCYVAILDSVRLWYCQIILINNGRLTGNQYGTIAVFQVLNINILQMFHIAAKPMGHFVIHQLLKPECRYSIMQYYHCYYWKFASKINNFYPKI